MLWGGTQGGLEVRREGGAVRVAGRFPYEVRTELAPGYHEMIARGAFASRVTAGEDVFLLAGHDFEKPLASRAAGTLTVEDGDDALTFEATVADATTWARDFLAAHDAGLVRGLSPGFRVPEGGALVTREAGATVRTVRAADLFEVSAVTRPAYPAAQIEARSWAASGGETPHRPGAAYRWRA